MVIDVELPKRKNIRLQGYDYSQNGYYYITICTNNRQHLFGEIISVVGDGLSVPIIELNENGKIIDEYIKNVAIKYENVKIDKYIIMPNHVHIILVNSNYENGLETQNGTGNPSPTIGMIIGWLKYQTTKCINDINENGLLKIWQRSYHDHIIRNVQKYQKICKYIETNPLKWQNDCYYKDCMYD